jgi:hypothetical protein
MHVYFINKVAVTNRQAWEHLAQAQSKKMKKKNEIRAINGDHKLETWHEPKRPQHET